MKTNRKSKKRISPVKLLLLALALAIIVFLVVNAVQENRARSDPHYGQVEVYNGEDYIWITPEKGVALNKLTKDDFSTDESGRPVCTARGYDTLLGIDVSEHQGDIDWKKVYDDGMRFAVIRIGGTYYGSGEVYSDDNFAANLKGAHDVGLKVGVYFFSQAITPEEARAEAQFVISKLRGNNIELPVYFDWERVDDTDARTTGLDGETLTQCAVAFCEEIENAGFTAGVYVYPDVAYNGYTLSELSDYTLWASTAGSYPYFYYEHALWQYSFHGEVDGVATDCDMNMLFIK